MTERQKQAKYQADLRLNILYTLPDICEALLMDIEDYNKEAGVERLKYEQKMLWNRFKKDAYKLRSVINHIPENLQYSYANTCDVLQTLILKVIDRCGEEDIDVVDKILQYIDSFPSKRNIEFKYD